MMTWTGASRPARRFREKSRGMTTAARTFSSPIRRSISRRSAGRATTSKYSVRVKFPARSRLAAVLSSSQTARGICLTSKFRANPNMTSRSAGRPSRKPRVRRSRTICRTSFRMTARRPQSLTGRLLRCG
jgi:hypothetical protein